MTQPAAETPVASLPEPVLFLLLLKDGTTWQVGESVPGSDHMGTIDAQGLQRPELIGQQALKIMRMIEREDATVVVYALPVAGSNFEKEKQGVIFKHPADQVKQSTYLARFDAFRFHLEQEVSEWEADEAEEDELEESEAPPVKLETHTNGSAGVTS